MEGVLHKKRHKTGASLLDYIARYSNMRTGGISPMLRVKDVVAEWAGVSAAAIDDGDDLCDILRVAAPV